MIKIKTHWLIVTLGFICLFFGSGCELGDPASPSTNNNNNNQTNQSYLLTIAATRTTIKAGDTLLIQVSVTDTNLLPQSSVKVILTTSFGILDTLAGNTGSSGKFITSFWATTPGSAVISATAGASSATPLTIVITDSTTIISATKQIEISAVPAFIPADGESRSEIRVIVKNEFNNPIVGEQIEFKSNLGRVLATAVSDSFGVAHGLLISDKINGTAFVTATLTSNIKLTVTIPVEFTGVAITITANPQYLIFGETSEISATVIDGSNFPIPNTSVLFTVSGGTILSSDTITSFNGIALMRLQSAATAVCTVTVTANGTQSKGLVYFSNFNMTLSSSKSSLLADGVDNTTITAKFVNNSGTAISGAEIEFSTNAGKFSNGLFTLKTTTNGSGEASATLISSTFADQATVTVTATSGTNSITRSIAIQFLSSKIKYIDLKITPSVIGTESQANITAIAKDSLNNYVSGEDITFTIVQAPGGGEYIDPVVVPTQNGQALSYFFSGTLPSNYLGIRIVASNFTGVTSDTISLTVAGKPYQVAVGYEIAKLLTKNEAEYTIDLSAIVTDINGNAVPDNTPVYFSVYPYAYFKKPCWIVKERTTLPLEIPEQNIFDFVFNFTFNGSPYFIIVYKEDTNGNGILDEGEDFNGNGTLNRLGEDMNGNGVLNTGEPLVDENANGYRDWILDSWKDLDSNGIFEYGKDSITAFHYETFTDQNADGIWNWPEDINCNGAIEPNTSISIDKIGFTTNGRTNVKLTYLKEDAWHYKVRVNAESGGIKDPSGSVFTLPILEDDVKHYVP